MQAQDSTLTPLRSGFYELSDEVLLYIFQFCEHVDLLTIVCVCKRWYGLGKDELLWKTKFQNRWNMWRGDLFPNLEDGEGLVPPDWRKMYVHMYHRDTQVVNRIIAAQKNGEHLEVCTMDRTGKDRQVISQPTDQEISISPYPLFSPHGDKALWFEGPDSKPILIVGSTNKQEQKRFTNVKLSPIIFPYWSPCGTRVSLLCQTSAARGSIKLMIIDVAGSQPPVTVSYGRPYFFSWAKDETSFVSKIGNRMELGRLQRDGTLTLKELLLADDNDKETGTIIGRFTTPVWSRRPQDRDTFLITVTRFLDEAYEERLVLAKLKQNDAMETDDQAKPDTLEMEILHDVATFTRPKYSGRPEIGSFIMSPEGSKVALFVPLTAQLFVINVSSLPSDRNNTNTTTTTNNNNNNNNTNNNEREKPKVVGSGDVVAYLFSPNGRYLVYLTFIDNTDGRWSCYDSVTEESFTFSNNHSFRPSGAFYYNYLGFFEQYYQSYSLWTPDSSAFLFAGSVAGSDVGVWLQKIDKETPPELVAADLALASWSLQ